MAAKSRVRSKRSSSYHHGDLRRALTEAAIELLAEVGPEFTLRQAAAKVSVTHSAAYRHFADRDALLAEVARLGFLELRGETQQAHLLADGPRARLEALIAAYVGFAWRHPAQYQIMFGPRLNESGRFPELEAAVLDALGTLIGAVGDLSNRDDHEDLALGVWSFVHGFVSIVLQRRIRVRSSRAAKDYAVRLSAPLLDGLAGAAVSSLR